MGLTQRKGNSTDFQRYGKTFSLINKPECKINKGIVFHVQQVGANLNVRKHQSTLQKKQDISEYSSVEFKNTKRDRACWLQPQGDVGTSNMHGNQIQESDYHQGEKNGMGHQPNL